MSAVFYVLALFNITCNWTSTVKTVTMLWTANLRSCGSIPGKSMRLLTSLKRLHCLSDPESPHTIGAVGWGWGVSFPRGKAAGHKVNISPLATANVRNEEITLLLLPLYAFMVWAGTTWFCIFTQISNMQQTPSRQGVYCPVKPVLSCLFRNPKDTLPSTQNFASRTLSWGTWIQTTFDILKIHF